LTTQELRLLTFIHCSAWRTASRCRATVAGSIKSSASNSTPPRLLVAAAVIGAERMGSESWISGERTTTSRAGSGCAVAPSPLVAVAASPTATSISSGAPLAASCTSGVNLSMGTAARISLPSASAPVNEKTSASASPDDYDYSLGGTIASAEYSPSTTLASGNVASAAGASDPA
jgi:hypothetical protein